ncbi:putative glycosyltransferase [Novosphingobium sp. Rr 2-17]|nr:putative glycosyltransferase [Novosphingobium sp. Rr 2-17]
MIYFHAPNVFASLFLLLRYVFLISKPNLIILHHVDIYGRPFFSKISRFLYNHLIGYADKLIVTSRKNLAVSDDIRRPCDIVEIPLGIDPDDYLLDDDAKERARQWRKSISGDAPVVGFVGRHARYKGLDVLVQAIAGMPEVHAFIAGDGPERAPSEALAQRLGIADRVHFFGGVTHEKKLEILAAIDVFAFPSTENTEAFGISQLEAMVVGVPVVASNLPTGVTDLAVDGETALLVEPGNVESLKEGLVRMLARPDMARRLADGAKRSSQERFTIKAMTHSNRELVESILANGRTDSLDNEAAGHQAMERRRSFGAAVLAPAAMTNPVVARSAPLRGMDAGMRFAANTAALRTLNGTEGDAVLTGAYGIASNGGSARYILVKGTPAPNSRWEFPCGSPGLIWRLHEARPDVSMFGAVGDGETDDTGALQSGLDYLAAIFGGGELLLSPLRYRVRLLALPKAASIIGDSGVFSTHYPAASNESVYAILLDGEAGITMQEGCSIRGVVIRPHTMTFPQYHGQVAA